VYKPENRDEELETMQLKKQVSAIWDLDKIIIDYLKQNYFFTNDGIKNNIELFKAADKKFDLLLFISELKRKASDKKNPQGYLINAIKDELGLLPKKTKGNEGQVNKI
jgi:hypothetical protein